MGYKAFISYRSVDREWADRIYASLVSRKIPPTSLFLDKERLAAGEDWEPQLESALNASDHLVVLWSTKAAETDGYVNEERKHFDLFCHRPSLKDPSLAARKIIFVLLNQDPPPGARRTHAISDIRDAGLYDKGATAVPGPVWDKLIDQIYEAVQERDTALPVGCIVLASTRQRLEDIDPASPFGDLESLGDALAEHGLSRAHFLDRYGDHANKWKPFGQARSIQSMLDALRDRVNETLEQSGDPSCTSLKIRLEFPDDVFWGKSRELVKQEVQRWRGSLAVVVVDPLSLYDRAVAQRLVLVSETLTTGLATFMALGVTPATSTRTSVRSILAVEAVKLHELLCEPALPLRDPRPLGGVNLDDELEMRRYLVTAIGQYANSLKPTTARPEAKVIDPAGLK
jgi:hypothetical protein